MSEEKGLDTFTSMAKGDGFRGHDKSTDSAIISN